VPRSFPARENKTGAFSMKGLGDRDQGLGKLGSDDLNGGCSFYIPYNLIPKPFSNTFQLSTNVRRIH